MSKIKEKVGALLAEAKISEPPISVEKIARLLKIRVKYAALEGDISGLMYRQKGKTIIGINALHSEVRQRFTLAHEIGHLYLGHNGDFFLDRAILFRNSRSSEGTDSREVDANRFAAELLMPENLVRERFENGFDDRDEDEIVSLLARIFEVSTQAMAIRLQSLGLISL